MQWMFTFSQEKRAWALLFLSAFGLLMAALYFQHVMDLRPCIQCIYQRTAVIGIMIAALIPLLFNHLYTRILAYAVWIYSAFRGLQSAQAHLDIIFAKNPFAMICDIVPNFPSFLPLHEWLPSIFGATGECNENSWQFLGMGMASWLQVVFTIYLVFATLFIAVNIMYALKKKA